VDLLGWITDRFTPPRQVVTPLDGARLVRSPDVPDFWFGNYVELDAEPTAAELEAWIARWSEVIGEPLPHRRIISWERPELHFPDDLQAVAERHGMDVEIDVIMVLGELQPRCGPDGFTARICRSDADWEAALAVGAADAPDQADFQHRLARHHRARSEAGFGDWWIGELDGQVAATAGLYWNDEGTIARYQRVDTLESARRRGCASALLTAMALDARKRLPDLQQIVIVAGVGEAGEQVYRRLGFEPASYGPSLVGPPPTG
jgi:N-acetylglutamate synthase-like GNAT family acetyltransferase